MITQCPKCKKILHNGKFLDFEKPLIEGMNYRLCPQCKIFLNKINNVL